LAHGFRNGADGPRDPPHDNQHAGEPGEQRHDQQGGVHHQVLIRLIDLIENVALRCRQSSIGDISKAIESGVRTLDEVVRGNGVRFSIEK
jgi:hypothetical protein